jgi:hypothetical protein
MAWSWSAIQEKFHGTAEAHWNLCEDFGLVCPFDVFEQLFFDHHGDDAFASLVQFVDFSCVRWEARELSGVALRRVAVPRAYQVAVDEARARTAEGGVWDEREEVLSSWEERGTWMRAPVIVTGEVLDSGMERELLVGFTRLGNLLGLLDRQLVPEAQRHRVWIGELDRV